MWFLCSLLHKYVYFQPEGEDELKKMQLMELAIINGTYRDSKQVASIARKSVTPYVTCTNKASVKTVTFCHLQPEGEDDLKKRQLMELAIINGTYRDTKCAPQTNTATVTSTRKLPIRTCMEAATWLLAFLLSKLIVVLSCCGCKTVPSWSRMAEISAPCMLLLS